MLGFGRVIVRHEIVLPVSGIVAWLKTSRFVLEMRESVGEPRLALFTKSVFGIGGENTFVSASQLRLLIQEAEELIAILHGSPLPHSLQGSFVWFGYCAKTGANSVRWLSRGESAPVLMDIERLHVLRNGVEQFLNDCQQTALRD